MILNFRQFMSCLITVFEILSYGNQMRVSHELKTKNLASLVIEKAKNILSLYFR